MLTILWMSYRVALLFRQRCIPVRAMQRKGDPFARLLATLSTCTSLMLTPVRLRQSRLHAHGSTQLLPCMRAKPSGYLLLALTEARTCVYAAGPASAGECLHAGRPTLLSHKLLSHHMHSHRYQDASHLHAELSRGRQHNGARGVAQGEAVAGAALLLAHALHQRQQVRQRLPAACMGRTPSAQLPPSDVTPLVEWGWG